MSFVPVTTTFPVEKVFDTLNIMKLAIEGLKDIGNIILTVSKIMGTVNPELSLEELGNKALQAEKEGITPDKFETYQEYIKAVEKFSTESELDERISQDVKCMKGIELAVVSLANEFAQIPIIDFVVTIINNPGYFTEYRTPLFCAEILKSPEFLQGLLNHINGIEKDDVKIDRTVDSLISVEKQINPDISDKEALKTVLSIRKE